MIFLLNRERILLEVVELARLKIAALLDVDPARVTTRIELNEGKVSPVFEVASEGAEELAEGRVRDVVAAVYSRTMTEYTARLEGLQMTRRNLGAAT
jgi:hypothetical protein